MKINDKTQVFFVLVRSFFIFYLLIWLPASTYVYSFIDHLLGGPLKGEDYKYQGWMLEDKSSINFLFLVKGIISPQTQSF